MSDKAKLEKLGFAHLGASQLIIWHKPAQKTIFMLKEHFGITMIISVLKEKENIGVISETCKGLQMKHVHIPFEGANEAYLQDKTVQNNLRIQLQQVFKSVHESEERILLHCSAGFHRTGISAYSLLRWTGLEPEEALETIKGMRRETYDGVGEWRVQLAEDFIV